MTPRTTLAKVPSERVAQGAVRALCEGRVQITEAGPGHVYALVQGSVARPYLVTYGQADSRCGAGWCCECMAHVVGGLECSHIVAVDRVWQPEPAYVTAPQLAAVRS